MGIDDNKSFPRLPGAKNFPLMVVVSLVLMGEVEGCTNTDGM